MNAKWDAGDRKGALAAVPERAIDELAVIGTPAHCARRCDATSPTA